MGAARDGLAGGERRWGWLERRQGWLEEVNVHLLEAVARPGVSKGSERHGRRWRRFWTSAAGVLRSTAIRFLSRGGSRDYENPYPVRGWSGDGPRQRGDELPRRRWSAGNTACSRRRLCAGIAEGVQGYSEGAKAVDLALSLRASALAGGGGVGLATAAAVVGAWARQGIGRDGVGFVQPWHSGIRGLRVAQCRVASLLGQRERGRARERQLRVGRAGEGRGEGSGRASGRGAPALLQLCQRESRAEVAWSAWKR
ncbi:hypothetical protein OsJ_17903 [Oryza sativa Japonica Group]|uniref:Uncharacterized protein n=1 Tax=Oryza sativa subsp. japonica TaxID=39947 RepID=B9FNN0_ORYSJ|nr:hypothetical protein OsJ_17903 [Oryza sativa Japonica Group]